MKTLKKSLSLFLAVLMLLGTFSVAAFAEAAYTVQTPPTTTIAFDARLTTSTKSITGAVIIDNATGQPFTGAVAWTWRNPGASTKITESQYCQAELKANGSLTGILVYIYVRVNGDETPQPPYPSSKKETEFSVMPQMVGEYGYDGVTTYGDVALSGTVVEKGTQNIVPGTLKITSPSSDNTISAGTRQVTVTFTPDDTENYTACIAKDTFTFAQGKPAWVGEAPVVYVPYGDSNGNSLTIDNALLNAYIEQTPNVWSFPLYDLEENRLNEKHFFDYGTHHLLVRPSTLYVTDCPNWSKDVFLPVTVIVRPVEAAFGTVDYNTVKRELTGKISEPGSSGASGKLNGTVDIYIGEEVFEGVQVTRGSFTLVWSPENDSEDATLPLRIVYNGLEGENAVVNEEYTGEILFNAKRTISFKHDKISAEVGNTDYIESTYLTAGTEVEIHAGLNDLAYWIITDTQGNEIELEKTWTTDKGDWFKFIMPEKDLVFDAVFQYELDEQEKVDNCSCLCHSENKIIRVIWMFINSFLKMLKLFGVETLCDCGYPHGTSTVL